jgi:hypothetical protein
VNEIKRLFLKHNPGTESLWRAIETLADGDPVAAIDRIQELAERDPSVSLPVDVLNEMFSLAIPEN